MRRSEACERACTRGWRLQLALRRFCPLSHPLPAGSSLPHPTHPHPPIVDVRGKVARAVVQAPAGSGAKPRGCCGWGPRGQPLCRPAAVSTRQQRRRPSTHAVRPLPSPASTHRKASWPSHSSPRIPATGRMSFTNGSMGALRSARAPQGRRCQPAVRKGRRAARLCR